MFPADWVPLDVWAWLLELVCEPCCVEPLCDELDEEVCDPEDGIVGLDEGMLTEDELGD
ncbi:MAG: hypothetical protein ACJ0RH_03560 [Gammaproteobacteria bacterium]